MSSRELSEWMAYDRIEPFGEQRADLRQAMTTAAVYNSIEAQRKHPKWHKPGDHLPFAERSEPVTPDDEPPDPEELKGKLLAFAGKRSG